MCGPIGIYTLAGACLQSAPLRMAAATQEHVFKHPAFTRCGIPNSAGSLGGSETEAMYLENLAAANGIRQKVFSSQEEQRAAGVAMHRAVCSLYLHAPVTELDHCVHQLCHIANNLPYWKDAMWAFERHQRFNRWGVTSTCMYCPRPCTSAG